MADLADLADLAGTDLIDDPLFDLPGAARNKPVATYRDSVGAHEIAIEGRVVVGSAPDADIVVQDTAVSRLHCELDPRQDGLWVRDLRSKNGTFVDGVMVDVARLNDGSTLRVGSTSIRVEYDPHPTPVDLWPLHRFGSMIGKSIVMRELFARMHLVAKSDATVLLQGETGTGKEAAARAIHEMSDRHEGPFVVVDCGSIPENLIEAELFGHEKGAFTGAIEARMGAIESAEGGVVFLDEVGELSAAAQPKLLRFLEARTIRRIGSADQRPVDVRVVSATHRDLRTLVNDGAFREDLYFRLAVLPITLPPLRERVEDIPLLIQKFLPPARQAEVTPDLLSRLRGRTWEGNVRELRNFVERALALGVEEAMSMTSADASMRPVGDLPSVPLDVPFKDLRERWVDHLEREYVAGLLARHGRNVTAVAEAAGLNRTYIHRLMKKHGL